MTPRESLLRCVREQQAALVELCRALVRIPSPDPPGDTRAICGYLREYLHDRGVPSRVYSVDAVRPNLVATLSLPNAGPTVVLNGHMETLPVGDAARWHTDPLGGQVLANRLYGRGACCMKSGLAALIHAALAVRDHGDALGGQITLVFASDEVNGGLLGTAHLLKNVADARGDVALVGEASLGVNFGHKGVVFAEFIARGDGGHGAYGFSRASAIDRMMELLDQLRRLLSLPVSAPLEVRSHLEIARPAMDATHGAGATDALLRLSVNVGLIEGGRKVNLIAEECKAHVDFRLPPGMTVPHVLERIEALLKDRPWVTLRLLSTHEPTFSSPDHPWFQVLHEAARDVLGEPPPFTFSHGFTDARFFRARGIPAAALGVAGQNVGSPDEYVYLESLVATAGIIGLALHGYLSTGHAPRLT